MDRLRRKLKLSSTCVGLKNVKEDCNHSNFSEFHTADSGIVSDHSSSTHDRFYCQHRSCMKHLNQQNQSSSIPMQNNNILPSSRSQIPLSSITEMNKYYPYPIDYGPIHPYMKTAAVYSRNENSQEAYNTVASSSESSDEFSSDGESKHSTVSSEILFVPRRTKYSRRRQIRRHMLAQIHETGVMGCPSGCDGCVSTPSNECSGAVSDGAVEEEKQQQPRQHQHQFQYQHRHYYRWDRLPYKIMAGIMQYLSIGEKAKCSHVCRNWYFIAWQPGMWRFIDFSKWKIESGCADISVSIYQLFRLLGGQKRTFCPLVQRIKLDRCSELTDESVIFISDCCPNLRSISMVRCVRVSNIAIFNLLTKCNSLTQLNVEGCKLISSINLLPDMEMDSRMGHHELDVHYLTELNVSSCTLLDDSGLCILASRFRQLEKLFLRNLTRVTNTGVKFVARYCNRLRQISLNHMHKITDESIITLYERTYENLEYLSVANCIGITDNTLLTIGEMCSRTASACSNISTSTNSSNKGIRLCHLRYLNLHKCLHITDAGLFALTSIMSQTFITCLNLSNCSLVTDAGLGPLLRSTSCRSLVQLDINNCPAISDASFSFLAPSSDALILGKAASNTSRSLQKLRQINVENTSISIGGIELLSKHLHPHCIVTHNVTVTDC